MNQIDKYFTAEKSESLLFVLVGCIAIVLAAYFLLKLKQPFFNGIAYPFILIALIQITVGASVYFRSPKDIQRVNQMVTTEKPKIQTEEIPRMETVMKNFTLYKWIEIALILIGIALFLVFPKASFWQGIGLGLFVQAGFMLLLDFFAENRGKAYLQFLQTIV
jgi:hypothetical protein